jgi:hypothetical protein
MKNKIFELNTIDDPRINNYLLEAQKIVKEFLGVSYDFPRVFLMKDREQLNVLNGREMPSWVEGQSYRRCIYILKDLLDSNPQRFRELVIHEFTHACTDSFCNRKNKGILWLEEGIANILAQQLRLTSPKNLDTQSLKKYSSGGDSYIYGVGYFWVNFLIFKYGKKKFLEFLKQENQMITHAKLKEIYLKVFKEKLVNPIKKIKTTQHINFYTFGKFKLPKDYDKKCESHIKRVCDILKIKYESTFDYFIFPDDQTYEKILGCNPTGRVFGTTLYSIYPFHPHEITHIILYNALDGRTLTVLSEGAAVLYGWDVDDAIWNGKKLDFWKDKYHNEMHLCDLIKDFVKVDNAISYPLSACFVRFLISNFGISKFKQLYKKLNFEMSFKEIDNIFKTTVGYSIDQLNTKFWK